MRRKKGGWGGGGRREEEGRGGGRGIGWVGEREGGEEVEKVEIG